MECANSANGLYHLFDVGASSQCNFVFVCFIYLLFLFSYRHVYGE